MFFNSGHFELLFVLGLDHQKSWEGVGQVQVKLYNSKYLK